MGACKSKYTHYGKGRQPFKCTVDIEKPIHVYTYMCNSPLEGAMRLKLVPLDFSFHFLWGRISFSQLFGTPKIKPWTIVHGFWPETEKFDFSPKKGYHMKGHLKRSRMAQISAP